MDEERIPAGLESEMSEQEQAQLGNLIKSIENNQQMQTKILQSINTTVQLIVAIIMLAVILAALIMILVK
jgi:ABC-type dipeptide/oligopeptide/nickel transport system permease component